VDRTSAPSCPQGWRRRAPASIRSIGPCIRLPYWSRDHTTNCPPASTRVRRRTPSRGSVGLSRTTPGRPVRVPFSEEGVRRGPRPTSSALSDRPPSSWPRSRLRHSPTRIGRCSSRPPGAPGQVPDHGSDHERDEHAIARRRRGIEREPRDEAPPGANVQMLVKSISTHVSPVHTSTRKKKYPQNVCLPGGRPSG